MSAGIDARGDTVAVAVAVAVTDQARRLLGELEVPNTEFGFARLVGLFETHQVVRVGIEGSGNFGRAVAVHLLLTWTPAWAVHVVEVPTLMTSRKRRPKPGQARSDPVDALAIARITARQEGLPPVRFTVGPAADLRPCWTTART